jgi:hypothetical protein
MNRGTAHGAYAFRGCTIHIYIHTYIYIHIIYTYININIHICWDVNKEYNKQKWWYRSNLRADGKGCTTNGLCHQQWDIYQ